MSRQSGTQVWGPGRAGWRFKYGTYSIEKILTAMRLGEAKYEKEREVVQGLGSGSLQCFEAQEMRNQGV